MSCPKIKAGDGRQADRTPAKPPGQRRMRDESRPREGISDDDRGGGGVRARGRSFPL